MSALDRLVKSFEAFKTLQLPVQFRNESAGSSKTPRKDAPLSKQDKIFYCQEIVENICNNQSRSSEDFQKLLGLSIESLLFCCNESDADVRLVANDCLNRLINLLLDKHLNTIQLELYKEIKNNGPALIVRAALTRFCCLTHLIRTSKCRPFWTGLVPCLLALAERRDDELIQECLSSQIDRITSKLIRFANQTELSILITCLVRNAMDENSVCKRSAAVCLNSICRHSNRPTSILNLIFSELYNFDSEEQNAEDGNRKLVGIFLTAKHLFPIMVEIPTTEPLSSSRPTSSASEWSNVDTPAQTNQLRRNLLHLMCLTLEHLQHNQDSQVVLGLLEMLQQFLRFPSQTLQSLLGSRPTDLAQIDRLTSELNQNDFAGIKLIHHSSNESFAKQLIDMPNTLNRLLFTHVLFKQELGGSRRLFKDQEVRVAPLVLGLSCIADLLPFCFDLFQTSSNLCLLNDLERALLYRQHPDPQLSSQCARIVSNLIQCAFTLEYIYDHFQFDATLEDRLTRLLIDNVFFLVLSESSVCAKNALIALKSCVNLLLKQMTHVNRPLLDLLRHLVATCGNSYWLIKVEILELFASIDYALLHCIELQHDPNLCDHDRLQAQVLDRLFVPFLSDSDHRVRQAVTSNIIRLTVNMYIEHDLLGKDCWAQVSALSYEQAKLHTTTTYKIADLSRDTFFELIRRPSHFDFVFPFGESSEMTDMYVRRKVTLNLQMLIQKLYRHVWNTIDNRHKLMGLLSTLSELTNHYPTTKYATSWHLSDPETLQLMDFLLHLITKHTPIQSDLPLHSAILNLLGNLTSGFAFELLRTERYCLESVASPSLKNKTAAGQNDSTSATNSLPRNSSKSSFGSIDSESYGGNASLLSDFDHIDFNRFLHNYTQHLLRVFQLIQLQFDDTLPSAASTSKSSQIISPLKRRSSKSQIELLERSELLKKVLDSKLKLEKTASAPASPHPFAGGSGSPAFTATSSSGSASHTATAADEIAYHRLQEVLTSSMQSTRNTLDFFSVDTAEDNRFIQYLRNLLFSFSQLFEIGSIDYYGRHADQLLKTIHQIMFSLPSESIVFIRQFLKCIFRTNLLSIIRIDADPLFNDESLWHETDQVPMQESNVTVLWFLNRYSNGDFKSKAESANQDPICCNPHLAILNSQRKLEKRLSTILSRNHSQVVSFQSYIRLFEQVVIKSLRLYTQCNTNLVQCEVLGLMRQLIKLRFNYSMVDSDQVFFTFLQKQFVFIENGQLVDCEHLIKAMFRFFVSLTYNQFHSQTIISLSRVIQLLDSLIVSGASFDRAVLPALQVLVEDTFLYRSGNSLESMKELDTMREMLLHTLFKVLHQPNSIWLINLVVNQSKRDGDDKFRKCSRDVFDQLMLVLAKQKPFRVDSKQQVRSLIDLFDSLSPTVFRPIDFILNGLFCPIDAATFQSANNDLYVHFLMHRMILLRAALIHCKEDMLFARLDQMRGRLQMRSFRCEFQVKNHLKSNEWLSSTDFTFPVLNQSFPHESVDDTSALECSKMWFARFIFDLIRSALHRLISYDPIDQSNRSMIVALLDYLLMTFTWPYISSEFPQFHKRIIELVETAESDDYLHYDQIESGFNRVASRYPFLVAHWGGFNAFLKRFHLIGLARVPPLKSISQSDSSADRFVSNQPDRQHIFTLSHRPLDRPVISVSHRLIRQLGIGWTVFLLWSQASDTQFQFMIQIFYKFHNKDQNLAADVKKELVKTICSNVGELFDMECFRLNGWASALKTLPKESNDFVQGLREYITTDGSPLSIDFVQKLLGWVEGLHSSSNVNIVLLLLHLLSDPRRSWCTFLLRDRIIRIMFDRLKMHFQLDPKLWELDWSHLNNIVERLKHFESLNHDLTNNFILFVKGIQEEMETKSITPSQMNENTLKMSFLSSDEFVADTCSKSTLIALIGQHLDCDLVDLCVTLLNSNIQFCDQFSASNDFLPRVRFMDRMLQQLHVRLQPSALPLATDHNWLPFNFALATSFAVFDEFQRSSGLNHLSSRGYYPFVAKSHQITFSEQNVHKKMIHIFQCNEFQERLFACASLLLSYVKLWSLLEAKQYVSDLQQPPLPIKSLETQRLYCLSLSDLQCILRVVTIYAEYLQYALDTESGGSALCVSVLFHSLVYDRLFDLLQAKCNFAFQITWISAVYEMAAGYDALLQTRFDIHFFTNQSDISSSDSDSSSDELLAHTARCSQQINCLFESFCCLTGRTLTDIERQLQTITLHLARTPLVNSYVMVPAVVWQDRTWAPRFACMAEHHPGAADTNSLPFVNDHYRNIGRMCGTLPSEVLLHEPVLQQFLHRINLIGFRSRIQFEEIWMSLLGVISLTNAELAQLTTDSTGDDHFALDQKDLLQQIALAVRGINSLLLQCKLSPDGFVMRKLQYHALDLDREDVSISVDCDKKPFDEVTNNVITRKAFFNTKYGVMLLNRKQQMAKNRNVLDAIIPLTAFSLQINEHLYQSALFGHRLPRIDRLIDFGDSFYSNLFGLSSIELLRNRIGLTRKSLHKIDSSSSSSSSSPVHIALDRPESKSIEGIRKQKKSSKRSSIDTTLQSNDQIDVNSCVHFLLDLYSQLSSHPIVQLQVLKSNIKLSDAFFDLSQFQRLLDMLFDQFKTAFAQEDEIQMQYLILGICKFYALIHLDDVDHLTIEKVRKSVEICLRSSFLPTQLNCLIGLNLIVQQRAVDRSQGHSTGLVHKEAPIITLLKDYVGREMMKRSTTPAQLNNSKMSCDDASIIFERELLLWNLSFIIIDLFVEDFHESEFAQKVFQLMLRVLRTETRVQLLLVVGRAVQNVLVSEMLQIKDCEVLLRVCSQQIKSLPFTDARSRICFHLLVTSIYVFGLSPHHTESELVDEILNLESISLLFDCARQSQCRHDQIDILLHNLPSLATDFLPEHNLLNKIISQFVSSNSKQLPQATFLLNRVFELLQIQSKQLMIDEWVCLSINSVTQIQPQSQSHLAFVLLLMSASRNNNIKSCIKYVLANKDEFCAQNMKFVKYLITSLFDELNEENRRTLWNALESTTSKSNIEFYAQLKDHYLWLKSSRQRD